MRQAIGINAIWDLADQGNYDHAAPSARTIKLARYHADGSLDTSFGSGGIGQIEVPDVNGATAGAITVTSDGGIVGVGHAHSSNRNSDAFLVKFQGSGSPPLQNGEQTMSTGGPAMMMFMRSGPNTPEAPAGWTMVVDHIGEDRFARVVLVHQDGTRLLLPEVRPDGSVSLSGTEQGDQITVERVSGLPPASSATTISFAFFQTPVGGVGLNSPFFDPAVFQEHAERAREGWLNDEQLVKDTIARGEEQAVLDQYKELAKEAKQAADAAQAVLDDLRATREFIRYKLDGLYDIYVEVTDAVTAKTRIRIDAAGGNDVVQISNNVPFKATLAGGWGADKLTSGKRRSLLIGGGGNDRLFSRSRVGAILDGGKGADKYYTRFSDSEVMARNDGDVLVIGNLTFDVTRAGSFGIVQTSETNPGEWRCYYLVEGETGTVDLLASSTVG